MMTAEQLQARYQSATFEPADAAGDRPGWLAARRTGIGSSDAPLCANMSRYGGPLKVYLDKVGLLPDRGNTEMEWGTRLEPVIAAAYADRERVRVEKPAGMFRSRKHPHMLANVDGLRLDLGIPVEIKNARQDDGYGEAGTDLVPDAHLIQVQHQMAVLDVDAADVAVLIAGSDFRVFRVRRDDSIIDQLVEIEQGVWQAVQKRLPPPPDWKHPTTRDLIRYLAVPDETAGQLVATVEQAELAAAYKDTGRQIGELERQKKELKARIEAAMGSHPVMLLPDGTGLQRRLVRRAGYTADPTEYIELRVRKNLE